MTLSATFADLFPSVAALVRASFGGGDIGGGDIGAGDIGGGEVRFGPVVGFAKIRCPVLRMHRSR